MNQKIRLVTVDAVQFFGRISDNNAPTQTRVRINELEQAYTGWSVSLGIGPIHIPSASASPPHHGRCCASRLPCANAPLCALARIESRLRTSATMLPASSSDPISALLAVSGTSHDTYIAVYSVDSGQNREGLCQHKCHCRADNDSGILRTEYEHKP